jgi:hypothetical protein
LSAEQLDAMNKIPIKVIEKQGKKKWTECFFALNSPNYWFYDRTDGKLYRMRTKVRLRGGFQTRTQAKASGIVVTDTKDFNDAGRSISYGTWPRPYIPGDHGCCVLLAVYYLTCEYSLLALQAMKETYHTEVKIQKEESIYLTDGRYEIIRQINQNMKNCNFVQIYPSPSQLYGTVNEWFGDSKNVDKFLIEYTDSINTSVGFVSHFVSLDTEVMLLYEPMHSSGPILVDRNCHDQCCFIETLKLHHNIDRNLTVRKIWKLQLTKKRKVVGDANQGQNKKKRSGRKQYKSLHAIAHFEKN